MNNFSSLLIQLCYSLYVYIYIYIYIENIRYLVKIKYLIVKYNIYD